MLTNRPIRKIGNNSSYSNDGIGRPRLPGSARTWRWNRICPLLVGVSVVRFTALNKQAFLALREPPQFRNQLLPYTAMQGGRIQPKQETKEAKKTENPIF